MNGVGADIQPLLGAMQGDPLGQQPDRRLGGVVDRAVVGGDQAGDGADIDDLKISKAYVNEAPTFKRFRARARGRGTRILKRNSHITIELSDE